MKWLPVALSAVGISVVVGCAKHIQSINLAAEREALLYTDRAWATAAKAGDLETEVSFWAEDAVDYYPDAPAAHGREAIRALVVRIRMQPGFSLTWEPQDAVVSRSGDLGYTSGRLILNVDEAGRAVTRTGYYVDVWKKLPNGLWKCSVETSVFGPVS